MLAAIWARRELRGGVRGLRLALACLALGVATIATVGGLRTGIERGLAEDARSLLGGDLDIQGAAQPLPGTLTNWLTARGARVTQVARLRSMLSVGAPGAGDRLLVDLKVVDGAWPLVGAADIAPAQSVADALAPHDGVPGLVADPLVLARLHLAPGDQVTLGRQVFQLRGALEQEPDRITGGFTIGPRVLISAEALPATGLIQPGSLVSWDARAAWPGPVNAPAQRDALRAAFPDTGWRIRLADEGAPGVDRFVAQASLFLTLVGLGALLVGGVGVGMGTRAWLEGRAETIAVLRCLGAPTRLIFTTFLLELLAIAGLGVAIGVVVGAALPAAALWVFADVLPAPARIGLYPAPLALAAFYGFAVTLVFALAPLGAASRISGAALFRTAALPARIRPGGRMALAIGALLALVVAVTLAAAPDRRFALWFCLAAAGAFLALRLAGGALVAASRMLPRFSRPWARLGVGALHAPGSPAALVLVARGLGLAILTTLGGVQANIGNQIAEQIPATAPSFYFLDVQPDQAAGFARALSGSASVAQLPSMRARIVAVDGVPAEQVHASPDSRWALEGDRGLTWSAIPPEGTHLVAGAWWPADYAGKPLVSLDAGLAHGWGTGIGGILRVNVDGRDIDLTIANLRDVAWRTLSMNFAMVASPGLLQSAPQTRIFTARLSPAQAVPVLAVLGRDFPNVTPIDVGQVLDQLATMLGRISAGLAGVGSLALLSGALVMAGAVAATQARRVRDAVILKVLGATRAQIRAAWMVEFAAIGLAAGVLAALFGAAAGWAVMRFVLQSDWHLPVVQFALIIAGALAATLVLGLVGSQSALSERPAARLRNP